MLAIEEILGRMRRHEPMKKYRLTCTSLVTLSLSDDDFGKMVAGKTQAQRLFMSGKLKIKGDVMKVYRNQRGVGRLLY